MKQVLQSYRTGDLSVVDVPAPGVEPGSVLVVSAASLISVGTDRMTMGLAKKSLLGKAQDRPDLVKKVLDRVEREGIIATGQAVLKRLDQPIPLGYSCTGRVVAVGDGVSGFAVGDRVACAGATVASHAEVNLVPQNLCVRVPEGLEDEAAAFVTVGAIALQGVRIAAPTLGECFAVIGLGLIGQLAVQLLKANGCTVLGIDLDPQKIALAKSLGADEALQRDEDVLQAAHGRTSGRGVDGVIIAAATSTNDPVVLAGELCRDRGRVVVVGAVGMEVPRRPYYDKELSFLQSRSYGPGRYDPMYEERGLDYPIGYVRWTEQRNLEAFLAQCAAGRIRVAPLISHRFPIDRAEDAYALIGGKARSATASGGGVEPLGVLLTYPAQEVPARTVPVAAPRELKRTDAGALRIGVVGAGAFASGTLVPAIAAVSGLRLVSIASARGVSARHLADRYRFERCTTDAAVLFQDAQIDAVFIATRPASTSSSKSRSLWTRRSCRASWPRSAAREGCSWLVTIAGSRRSQVNFGSSSPLAPHRWFCSTASTPGRCRPIHGFTTPPWAAAASSANAAISSTSARSWPARRPPRCSRKRSPRQAQREPTTT